MSRSLSFTLAVLALAMGCGDESGDPLGVDASDPASTGLETGVPRLGSEGLGGPASAVGRSAGGATLTTDKDDYAPGETVVITAAGWQPGETVEMVVSEDPADAGHPPTVLTSVADENGEFVNRSFLVDTRHLGVTFTLVATGEISGETLSVTFTDGTLQVAVSPAGIFGSAGVSVQWIQYTNSTDCGVTAGNNLRTATLSTRFPTTAPGGSALGIDGQRSAKFVVPVPSNYTYVGSTSQSGVTVSVVSSGSGSTTLCVANENAQQRTLTLNYEQAPTNAATAVSQVSGTGVAGGTATLSAVLKAGTTPLQGKTISFKLNGADAGTAQTDANGVARRENVTLGSTAAGSYPDAVDAAFAGDASNLPSNARGTLTVSAPAPTKLAFTSDAVSIGRSDCSDAITVQTQTAAGAAASPSANVTVHLTTSATASGRFYGDANCSTAVTSVGIGTNAHSASFYYKDTGRGTPTLTARDGATTNPLAAAQLPVTVSDLETATSLGTSDASSTYGDELEFTATVRRKSNNAAVTEGSVTFKAGGNSCSDAEALADGVAVGTTGTAKLKTRLLDAGTYRVRACYGGDGSYAGSEGDLAQTVAKKAVTVTVEDRTREYGLDNPVLDGTLQGVVGGDNITAQYATAATRASNVGTHAITVALSDPGSRLGNYTLPSPMPQGVLTITPASLTVSVNSPSRTYGEDDPELTGGITGIRNNDAITLDYTTAATKTSDVGEYAIDVTISDSDDRLGNYTVSPSPLPKGKLTVTPAPLTVTAQDKQKVYDGQAFSPFTVGYSGFVLGQGPSVLGGTLGFGGTAAGAVSAGTYTVTPSGLTSANYAITFAGGKVTISPRPITLRAKDAGTIDYADPAPSFAWEIVSGDFIGSDQTAFAGAVTYQVSSSASPLPVGTHTITPKWAAYSNGNYAVSLASPGTGSLVVRSWAPKGFYQPTDMSRSSSEVVYNTVKAGSTVPLKFEVFKGATAAVELRELSVVKPLFAKAVSCTSGVSDEIEMLATGGTSVRFDPAGDQFIYNWQTPRQAGSCYLVTVTTADGSPLQAYFRLK